MQKKGGALPGAWDVNVRAAIVVVEARTSAAATICCRLNATPQSLWWKGFNRTPAPNDLTVLILEAVGGGVKYLA